MLSTILLIALLAVAQESPAPPARQPLSVLYAGDVGSPREKAFTDFLRARFEKVATTTPADLLASKGAGFDVIVADGSVDTKDERLVMKGCTRSDFPEDWSRPTVLIASAGKAVEHTSKIGDFGGFRWFVRRDTSAPSPPDKPAAKKPDNTRSEVQGEHFNVRASTTTDAKSGTATVRVDVTFDDGWHGYAPGTKAGHPTSVSLKPEDGLEPTGDLSVPAAASTHATSAGDEAWLTGTATFRQVFRIKKGANPKECWVEVSVTAIVCDAQKCLPPQELGQTIAVQTP